MFAVRTGFRPDFIRTREAIDQPVPSGSALWYLDTQILKPTFVAFLQEPNFPHASISKTIVKFSSVYTYCKSDKTKLAVKVLADSSL